MMRIGLVGTGFWAENTHCPSLATHPDVVFVGIWGRNSAEAMRLAEKFGVRAFSHFDDLVAESDILDFAIPPLQQGEYALKAIREQKHLLLEKPVSQSGAQAEMISKASEHAGLSATVFLTRLFDPVRRAWLNEQVDKGHTSGHVQWISAALSPGSPYAQSAWRQKDGLMWDVGPHVISQVELVLGAIEAFTIDEIDPTGLTLITFSHEGGKTSTATMTGNADPSEKDEWISFSNGTEEVRCPPTPMDFVVAHQASISALLRQIAGQNNPDDAPSDLASNAAMTTLLEKIDRARKSRMMGVTIKVAKK